jgi:branched-chain amino acid transport system substrate-binding protein
VAHRDVSLRKSLSRRQLLKDSAAVAGGMGALSLGQFIPWVGASAEDHPAIGTWPAGSQGDTVNVAAAVPRTGTYAVQGEDELKGWQLAVEHINNGDPLLQKIAPKVTKGLLGKKVNLLAADSAAKPN